MKRVLMIGGTGTISTPIMEMLAKDSSVELFVLNRGLRKQLPEGVQALIADMNDLEAVKQQIMGLSFDCVINFIIMTKKQAQQNIDLFMGKTKQFILISTVCVLDHELTCRIDEESSKGNAYSLYGQEKAACEELFLNAYHHGFPVTIVRPSQTYSNDRIPLSVKGNSCWSVVQRMLQGKEVIVHGDGQSIWASTHALDFAKGFFSLIANQQSIGEIYQIMNAQPHTWDMVYQTLARLYQVPYRPVYISTELLRVSGAYDFESSIQGDKRWSNLFDTSKIRQINPEFQCDIDLTTGLSMYQEYMDLHPEYKKEDLEFDKWCDETIALYHRLETTMKQEIR